MDDSRLAIGGGSAGGGLTAALGLLTRDRGEIPLAYQLLVYPMLDDRTVTTADPHPHTGEFIWTPEANHFGWASLLGREPGGADVSPYAAAAREDNLAGLPPTYIGVGALDLFLDEDLEYARRLLRAGVPTELQNGARKPPSFMRGMNGPPLLTDHIHLYYTPCSRRDVQLVGDRCLHTNTKFFSRRAGVCGHSRRATGAFGSAGGRAA